MQVSGASSVNTSTRLLMAVGITCVHIPALCHYHDQRRNESAYSCSCCTNPKLGSADLRLVLTYWIACAGVQPYSDMRNAQTTLVLRLTPSMQCTRTRAFGSCSALRMKAVADGRCATSSENGRSSRGYCARWMGSSCGIATYPRIAERMWVIPSVARAAGFSAKEMSETYSLGNISDAPGVRSW